MGETVVFFLALLFIWIGWGFWVFIGIFAVGLLISWIGKPKYSFETNWGIVLSRLGVIGLAIFSIHDKWNNPVITAISIATALILVFTVR